MADAVPESYPVGTVFLKRVQIAFPDVYVPKSFEGTGEKKYSSVFLVVPGSQNDLNVQAAIKAVAQAKWGEKAAQTLKALAGQAMKYAYISGDQKAYAGFEGKMALTAKRKEKDGPVRVLDRDLTVLTQESGLPYGGSFVNARVQLWAQANEWGTGMRCTLMTVQFVADGESFGGAPPATEAGFSAIEPENADDLVG